MKLSDLLPVLQTIAPLELAEKWDNVGLLVGDDESEITRAMLTIDYTREVADETRAAGCELVIAYHPVIFEGLKRLTAPSVVFDAIADGIAIYSPHTALDVAEGGTNDVLADVLGISDRQPLRPAASSPWHFKLVTFVPEKDAEKVCEAIFQAGAGWIGRYSHCSFRSPGTGTFLGQKGTNPTVGEPGKLEYAPELRIETIVPAGKINAVVAALLRSHPYQEPAFDIMQLTTPPQGRGMGRVGTLPGIGRRELIEKIKHNLGVANVLIAGPADGTVRKVACCAGSCGDLVNDALGQQVELLLTGELRHHDALKAAAAGMTVVCALHSNSERLTLQHLARRLGDMAPEVEFMISQQDRDPFTVA